jgi:hypothetical protein
MSTEGMVGNVAGTAGGEGRSYRCVLLLLHSAASPASFSRSLIETPRASLVLRTATALDLSTHPPPDIQHSSYLCRPKLLPPLSALSAEEPANRRS